MENETKEKAQQHEDAALKVSTLFFAQELLPYWGIEGKEVGIAPTELAQIELHKQYLSYLSDYHAKEQCGRVANEVGR